MRALMVGPDSPTMTKAAGILDGRGLDPLRVAGGALGLEALWREKPSVLVCGLRMQDMDALSFLGIALAVIPASHVVVVSELVGAADRPLVAAVKRFGVAAVVTADTETRELSKLLRRVGAKAGEDPGRELSVYDAEGYEPATLVSLSKTSAKLRTATRQLATGTGVRFRLTHVQDDEGNYARFLGQVESTDAEGLGGTSTVAISAMFPSDAWRRVQVFLSMSGGDADSLIEWEG